MTAARLLLVLGITAALTLRPSLAHAQLEAFVERQAGFTQDPSNSDIIRTTDSTYRVLRNRIVTE